MRKSIGLAALAVGTIGILGGILAAAGPANSTPPWDEPPTLTVKRYEATQSVGIRQPMAVTSVSCQLPGEFATGGGWSTNSGWASNEDWMYYSRPTVTDGVADGWEVATMTGGSPYEATVYVLCASVT